MTEFKEQEIEIPQVEQKESIKLTRNSKGYNWEIRLLDIDIDRLEKLNNQMILKFKQGENK